MKRKRFEYDEDHYTTAEDYFRLQLLNQRGEQGWELVHLSETMEESGDLTVRMFFMREKQE